MIFSSDVLGRRPGRGTGRRASCGGLRARSSSSRASRLTLPRLLIFAAARRFPAAPPRAGAAPRRSARAPARPARCRSPRAAGRPERAAFVADFVGGQLLGVHLALRACGRCARIFCASAGQLGPLLRGALRAGSTSATVCAAKPSLRRYSSAISRLRPQDRSTATAAPAGGIGQLLRGFGDRPAALLPVLLELASCGPAGSRSRSSLLASSTLVSRRLAASHPVRSSSSVARSRSAVAACASMSASRDSAACKLCWTSASAAAIACVVASRPPDRAAAAACCSSNCACCCSAAA